jgi:hypothetical protein
LVWNRGAVGRAQAQALRYAHAQRVSSIAVSDGIMLYVADVTQGGVRDRLYVSLIDTVPPKDLWWVSVHGIYRKPPSGPGATLRRFDETPVALADPGTVDSELLHPKYRLPARCFAYVENAGTPATWKLPYLCADGSVDQKRLPKAVGAVLSNYRGARVRNLPEQALRDVLVRLAAAATECGRMPDQDATPAPVYAQLAAALEQMEALQGPRVARRMRSAS